MARNQPEDAVSAAQRRARLDRVAATGWLSAFSASLLAACVAEVPGPHGPSEFRPCDSHECAVFELPSEHGAADGLTRRIAVRRRRAVGGASRQLWLLPGGPGIAGTRANAPLLDLLSYALPETDLYTLDLHGAGDSDPLTCPAAQAEASAGGVQIVAAEVPDCLRAQHARFAQGLAAYGLTAAAHDLAALIGRLRSPDQRVLVLAQSAGTLWAQRLLLLYPDAIDALVMESFVPPDFSARSIDATAEAALERLLDQCAHGELCARHFKDPTRAVRALWPMMERGHCAAVGLTAADIQHRIFLMLAVHPWNTLIPSILFRLSRCSQADVELVRSALVSAGPSSAGMTTASASSTPTSNDAFAPLVFQLIVASELWDHPQWTTDEAYREHLATLTRNSLLGGGAQGLAFSETMAAWPKYAEPFDGEWPDTEIPLLTLHGALDPRVAEAAAAQARERYTKPNQRHVSFPFASHGLLGATPTDRGDCATELAIEFLQREELPLEPQCVRETSPIDVDGRVWGHALVGASHYW